MIYYITQLKNKKYTLQQPIIVEYELGKYYRLKNSNIPNWVNCNISFEEMIAEIEKEIIEIYEDTKSNNLLCVTAKAWKRYLKKHLKEIKNI